MPIDSTPSSKHPSSKEPNDRFFWICLGITTALAVGLRLWWVWKVQAPGEAIYSDMKSYITAARQAILWGEADPRDIYPSCFPYGAPYIYALQMRIFGMENYTAMAIIQALMGAAVTPLTMLTARRTWSHPVGYILAGLLAALWYPQLTYVGFFTSEIPFACLVMANLWLWLRFLQTGKSPVWTGIVAAIGFTVRPQLLLTALLGLVWAIWQKHRLPHLSWKRVGLWALPIVLMVGLSSVRHYAITGQHALIAANGPLGRFFADTDYAHVKASHIKPDGETRVKRFTPPARTLKNGFEGSFEFEGWRCDPTFLEPERERIVSSKGLLYRPYLIQRNTKLLYQNNNIWPEIREAKQSEWRKKQVRLWAQIPRYSLIPLALLGLLSLLWRRNLGLEQAGIHIATMIYAAAFYFGEQRYRIPYDAVIILLAIQGLLVLLRQTRSSQRQERSVGILYGLLLGVLILLMTIPWPPAG